ncbi:hypothetical protein P691DRAFT_763371 [Macrolepiota fuliginosa MF-IS2]|uniref:Uncharacterized protein n=1 Tax=Macrolepiota fuliginosa MF-IS2 TaxID=1400762 RepID=A0A9P6C0K0_9AGAR|nr:hypothetical protein P691DRAFT_763371 [Macrolepiota fuliginosa MF-IS2]
MSSRNWDAFKNLSRIDRRLYLTVYLRLIICTLIAGITFIFSMLAFVFRTPQVAQLMYPAGPTCIALVFGTQRHGYFGDLFDHVV